MSYQELIGQLDYIYRGFWREYGAKGMDHLPLVNEGKVRSASTILIQISS